MAYKSLTASVSGSAFSVSLDPGLTYGTSVKPPSKFNLPALQSLPFAFGTGAGKINLAAVQGGTLAVSTPVNVDLSTMTDPYGAAVNFAKVRGLMIVNFSTSAVLTVGAAASNPWTALMGGTTPTFFVGPGYLDATTGKVHPGYEIKARGDAAGFAVSGSSKVLKLDPGASTFDYFLALIGE